MHIYVILNKRTCMHICIFFSDTVQTCLILFAAPGRAHETSSSIRQTLAPLSPRGADIDKGTSDFIISNYLKYIFSGITQIYQIKINPRTKLKSCLIDSITSYLNYLLGLIKKIKTILNRLSNPEDKEK